MPTSRKVCKVFILNGLHVKYYEISTYGRFWILVENEKGAGVIRTFFSSTATSIIAISTYPPRQISQLYFPSRCSELSGKSSKTGLDRIWQRLEMVGVQEKRPVFGESPVRVAVEIGITLN